MTAKYRRDPKTQPQIGEEVVYLPEGVCTKVIAYEWDVTVPPQPPKIRRYQLACGVTVAADHIAQGSDTTPVAEKAETARIEAEAAARKEHADAETKAKAAQVKADADLQAEAKQSEAPKAKSPVKG